MLIDSALFSRGSGSLGGLTLSHNAGGIYLRARTMPVNPNTPQQAAVRAAAAFLVNRWTNTLTPTQRGEWDNYAASTPLIGPLGDARNVSGQNMYVRGNLNRVVQVHPIADAAPTVFNLGSFTPLVGPVVSVATQLLTAAFDNTDAWANEDDAWLMAFVSRPQNATINFFNGPYRFAGDVEGDAITPPVSPLSVSVPFPVVLGQVVYARFIVLRVDGRMSNDQVLSGPTSA